MREPTKNELKNLILDLFEVLEGYRNGHNGRTEPYACDCQFCKKLDDLTLRLDKRLSGRSARADPAL